MVSEYNLSVDIQLVRLNCNKADHLTRMPQRWLDAIKKEVELVGHLRATSASDYNSDY